MVVSVDGAENRDEEAVEEVATPVPACAGGAARISNRQTFVMTAGPAGGRSSAKR